MASPVIPDVAWLIRVHQQQLPAAALPHMLRVLFVHLPKGCCIGMTLARHTNPPGSRCCAPFLHSASCGWGQIWKMLAMLNRAAESLQWDWVRWISSLVCKCTFQFSDAVVLIWALVMLRVRWEQWQNNYGAFAVWLAGGCRGALLCKGFSATLFVLSLE